MRSHKAYLAAAKTAPLRPAVTAEDLDALRKSVEDSAAVGGGLWLSYLFVLFYLGIAAGAVTHTDLFLERPVKLPFLNVELSLLAFFALAPFLFLLVHAYVLVHLKLLADRVAQFDAALDQDFTKDHSAWRRRLPGNIFVQFLGAPEEDRHGSFGLLLALILWVTLALAPTALFLLLQIKFLPYHSLPITWANRIVLVLDLGLLWWLWGGILRGRALSRSARVWKRLVKPAIGALLTASVVLFAVIVATFPGEWQEEDLPSLAFIPMKGDQNQRKLVSLQERLFGGVDMDLFLVTGFLPNILILPDGLCMNVR